MQKKDNYLFSLILVGCLFFLFCVLTHKGNCDYTVSDTVKDMGFQQLYVETSTDNEVGLSLGKTNDFCNAISKRSNLLRGKYSCRGKEMTLLFVLFMTLCLWKQTSSFYFKINKKNNLDTFNVYDTPVRRGPPIIISITI